MISVGAVAVHRPILATIGASVSVLAVYAGNEPGPLSTTLHGVNVMSVVVFVGLIAGGLWLLSTASRSAWRWGAVIGVCLATAQLAGLLLRGNSLSRQLAAENLPWVAVHWVGTSWMVTCGLVALIWAIDTHDLHRAPSGAANPQARARPVARLVASLRAREPGRRRRALLVVMGILVLSRVPYLIVYWPGIVPYDTFRGYSYARGVFAWDTYDPVGHSMLVAVVQWLGPSLGWGDAGGVAIGTVALVLAGSAAFTFMLGRLAVWRVHPGIWVAAAAWLVLLPIFGIYSVQLGKDVPFSLAVVIFFTCVGELCLGRRDAASRLWPWVALTVAGIVAFMMRNNGIHVLLVSLPLLLIPLRHHWKRIMIVAAAIVSAYAIYVGPVYALLDVQPGPKEEAYSVPFQQLGLIARLHHEELSTADQEFYLLVFDGMPAEELGKHYVPWLADPMKLTSREAWADHSTAEFLVGWVRIAATYPVTAIRATVGNTVGYWDPEGPSYDGINRWSANDARLIHLDIPSGKPTTGLAAAIESSGFFPTRTYGNGLGDDGYRAIPVLGLAMSPGPVCWLWLIAGLLVIRAGDRRALAVFVPALALVLSFLVGPVSGGQRYSLPLFMALPVAVAAVALARRGGGERRTRARTGTPHVSALNGEAHSSAIAVK